MGVTGTVMGMVNILGNMGGDTNALAKSISVAFIATFYGVLFANSIYLPMAGRIKSKAERECMVSGLIVEGLLSIQAGENPRIIKEKLNLALLEKLAGKKPIKEAEEEGK
jgi:chemotaxis protein MotA